MKKGLLKKIVCIAAVAVMGISIIGCGKTPNAEANKGTTQTSSSSDSTTIDAIKGKGKLVIGTSADYPPYEFHKTIDGKDKIVGFDIDIANEVAKSLGVELEIKDMDFDGLLVALQAGKVDMVFAGMTPTDERKQNVDFSEIYFTANHTFMMKKGEEGTVKSIEDLKGKKIGVQKGSIQEGIAKDNFEAENIKSLAKVTDLTLNLKNGKVDAVLVEAPVGKMYVEKNKDLALTNLTIEDKDGGCAIALKKGSKELQTEVDKTIKKLKDDNKIDEFVIKANELLGQE